MALLLSTNESIVGRLFIYSSSRSAISPQRLKPSEIGIPAQFHVPLASVVCRFLTNIGCDGTPRRTQYFYQAIIDFALGLNRLVSYSTARVLNLHTCTIIICQTSSRDFGNPMDIGPGRSVATPLNPNPTFLLCEIARLDLQRPESQTEHLSPAFPKHAIRETILSCDPLTPETG